MTMKTRLARGLVSLFSSVTLWFALKSLILKYGKDKLPNLPWTTDSRPSNFL